MKPDHERVTKLLTDTVTLLCKNGLSYDRELRIQGLIGITVDSNEVFLVAINDSFCCSSDSTVTSAQSLVADSASAPGGSQSRKRSASNDVVDLTRLVETPNIATAVQRSPQLPSSISPMHHGVQTRPRSAGSVSQTRSRAVTPNSANVTLTHHHSQPAPRQPPVTTAVASGHQRTSSDGRRNSAERLGSSHNQHSNALALVDTFPGQRPHAGYIDSIRSLMLTCDRQLPPQQGFNGHSHRQQPPAAGASGWSGADLQRTIQHRPLHQHMAAAGDIPLPPVGRRGAEHFGIPPPVHSQHMLPAMPGNAYVRRPEGDPVLRYMHTNTVSQPSMLPGQHVQGVPRPAWADCLPPPFCDNMHQVGAATQGRQLANSAAYFQPPAKRHAPPGHSPRQVMQSCNPALMQNQLPRVHDCFPQISSTLFSQQTGPLALNPPALGDMSALDASCVTSSPVIKPPSSPVQAGRRSRPRPVEHIDLCGDDETADSESHIPVSSIVIQPDNITDLLTAADDVERSGVVSADTSDLHHNEFEPVAETSLLENNLPPLSRIREIVPLDDGVDNEDGEVSMVQNTVAAETVGQSTSTLFAVPIEIGVLSDNEQSRVSNRVNSELSSVPQDVSVGLVSTCPHSQTGIDSELARLSADESQQMTALYFDTEDSDMNGQT